MKKLLFLFGGAVGFLLGSRLGRGPYEAVEQQVRRLTQRPEFQPDAEESASLAPDLATSTSPLSGTSAPVADTLE